MNVDIDPESNEGGGTKLFIGNLAWAMKDEELQKIFAAYPSVKSAEVIVDEGDGCSKGIGFVVIEDPLEAAEAINQLNGFNVDGGRPIYVSEVLQRDRPRGRFGAGVRANPVSAEPVSAKIDAPTEEVRIDEPAALPEPETVPALPPALAERLLRMFIRKNEQDGMLGDLEEEFYFDVENLGLKQAQSNYWRETIKSLFPLITSYCLRVANRFAS